MAVICSIVGVIILWFISGTILPDESISYANIDNSVIIQGEIRRMVPGENLVLIDVERLANIKVVVFSSENLSVSEGDTIEVVGVLEEYEGKLEVVAERITRLGT